MSIISENIAELVRNGIINIKGVILWGISVNSNEVIEELRKNEIRIHFIVDNFKREFWSEYSGINIEESSIFMNGEYNDIPVLIGGNYTQSIRKQLHAYGVHKVYNFLDIEERNEFYQYDINYGFDDRSRGKEYLCYILAGYEPELWQCTLTRIASYYDERVDVCLVSSGKYDEKLDQIATINGWSYLYTDKNQVCFAQNKVLELHPLAKYVIKMDEDMFIGEDFFDMMISGYNDVRKNGEYRINFVVPVIPLNCNGYVSYLDTINKKAEYEGRFGRAYRNRFSAIFSVAETAEYLWDTMTTFDEMAKRFSSEKGWRICDCYFNIGCIMYSRERWLLMGKWPEKENDNGMGTDEKTIYDDGVEKDLSVYELKNVLVGHLAFGHQKSKMMDYFRNNRRKFEREELHKI